MDASRFLFTPALSAHYAALSASMHIDAVEEKFGDDGVLILRAGIDLQHLKLQRPIGFRIIMVAERTEFEALHGASVGKQERGVWFALVPHAQFLHA